MKYLILLLGFICALNLSAQDSVSVSQLPAATSPDANDLLYFIEDGTSKNITRGLLFDATIDSVAANAAAIAANVSTLATKLNISDTASMLADYALLSEAGDAAGDSSWTSISVDTINEFTSAHGVDVDGLHIENGNVEFTGTSNGVFWDVNTGIYEPTSDNLTFYIAGGNEAVMTVSQFSPSTTGGLDLGSPTLYFDESHVNTMNITNGGTIIDYNSGTGEMRFTDAINGANDLSDLIGGGDMSYSDTATMLAPYITRGDTAAMLSDYALLSEAGTGISFGTDNQIPFTNSGGNDFDYSSNLIYDGARLRVSSGLVVDTVHLTLDNDTYITSAGGLLKISDDANPVATLTQIKRMIGGKAINELIHSPGSGNDGYSITWDNGANEYTLSDVSGGSPTDTVQLTELVRLLVDTTLLWSWDVDSSLIATSSQVAAFYHYGPDTLYITQTRVGVPNGQSCNFTFNLQYAAGRDDAPTTLFTTAKQVEGTEVDDVGEVDTAENPSIPPGRWCWLTIDAITTKPNRASFNFIGYEY